MRPGLRAWLALLALLALTIVPTSGRARRLEVQAMPDPAVLSDEQLADELRQLIDQDKRSARRWWCPKPHCDGLPHLGWRHHHARATQHPPAWRWRVWMILTGRGWGKTRSGAELVAEWVKKPAQQIVVLAKKQTLVVEICFDAPRAGLLAVLPPEDVLRVTRGSPAAIYMRNGSIIHGFGAEVPDNLRGYAFDKGWMDEYAAWPHKVAQEVYDMVWFCLRESPEPQIIITTTPKPLSHIKKVVKRGKEEAKRAAADDTARQPAVVLTRGHMSENKANLSDEAREEINESYQGTRLGRQEISGELLEDVQGALWQGWMFEVEGFRVIPGEHPELDKKVVSVDPAVTSTEMADLSAIVVAGRDFPRDSTYADQRPHGYTLHTEQGRWTPTKTMERAAELYHLWGADYVVLEANNGGDYLATVLRQVDPTVQYRIVHATKGKRARAAPVAQLYEQYRWHHVGPARRFDELETQQTTYVGVEDEESPDLLDALVWAATDLLLDRQAPATKGKTKDKRLAGRR